jgi:hypothetical protein
MAPLGFRCSEQRAGFALLGVTERCETEHVSGLLVQELRETPLEVVVGSYLVKDGLLAYLHAHRSTIYRLPCAAAISGGA